MESNEASVTLRMRSVGLRTQILLMLLGAAILPLALVGMWLTSSAERAGEDLLRSHMGSSADGFSAAVETRWGHRRGDIALIAENEASVRAVASDRLTNEDRVYLDALAASLGSAIPLIQLRDSSGAVRWESTPAVRSAAERARNGVAQPTTSPGPVISVETPIVAADGRRIGVAVTGVAVSGLVPRDSAWPLVPGARVAIRSAASKTVLVPLGVGAPFPEGGQASIADAEWLVTHRGTVGPELEIAIAAPLAPYVKPFERVRVAGLVGLGVVALLATILTAVLATRTTRPLEELSSASDAVTQGRLDRRVSIAGPTEVRHVGAAFNVMTEHLRATLDVLARRSALAAVGEFATSLSHDVRNALTAVKVDLQRAAIRGVADPVADGLVNRALNNVARLENTVTAALRVARQGQAPVAELDLRAAIANAVETVQGTFASIPAVLDTDLPPGPVIMQGDAAALQQLFANLLFNAAQALSVGGHARVVLRAENGVADVHVSDSGSGIAPAEMAKLESPFYSSKANGTGLGLPIARQIVAGHGGELAIESARQRGTTVRIRFPLVNGSYNAIARSVAVPQAAEATVSSLNP